MRRLAAVALLALSPALTLAQDQGAPASPAASGLPEGAPTGLTGTVSLGGGGELGLDQGKAGILELEAAVGYEFQPVQIRPELAIAFGVAPDDHVALRPGIRVTLPGYPIQLRAALDASNARTAHLAWRWLLVGVAGELRFTSLLGLYAEIDTGAKLSSDAGLPLLVRAGASFRF
jgi:hypothetical protein